MTLWTRRTFLYRAGLILPAVSLGWPAFSAEKRAPTRANIEGPFYRKDAPWRAKLAEKLAGEPLAISGRVLSTDGSPIEGAVVDLWHADATGMYDNDSEKFLCRGRQKSGAEGAYAFETVMPAPYDLDGYGPGKAFRPAHVHYKASADGYKPLTTQLYFKGDKYLERDPFALPSLVIPLEKGKGTFDIVLAPA